MRDSKPPPRLEGLEDDVNLVLPFTIFVLAILYIYPILNKLLADRGTKI
ncbi:MAG TPA: hypothetical protein VJR94_01510 [Candidatus Nitrosocosmicus sp.]|nr:hypothetical protein [Candidatus Nitrosocosmicus sp.]